MLCLCRVLLVLSLCRGFLSGRCRQDDMQALSVQRGLCRFLDKGHAWTGARKTPIYATHTYIQSFWRRPGRYELDRHWSDFRRYMRVCSSDSLTLLPLSSAFSPPRNVSCMSGFYGLVISRVLPICGVLVLVLCARHSLLLSGAAPRPRLLLLHTRPCPVGSYSPSAASTTCTLCPAGYWGGAESLSACNACPGGTARSPLGRATCAYLHVWGACLRECWCVSGVGGRGEGYCACAGDACVNACQCCSIRSM